METRPFGHTGVRLPVIGQGTWYMERDAKQSARAIRRGVELGMTHIDTAEMYGSGAVERIVGEAIAGRRESVYLVSKVLPSNASRAGTVEACEKSLRRLGTDYLDLYLLHWPGSHPLAETLAGFEELERAGKIRAFGVSNFDVGELDEIVDIAGRGRIACNQVLYHCRERAIENALIARCREHGVPIVAYSPVGHGRIPGPKDGAGGEALHRIAASRGVSAHQVALRFVVREPDVFAIPKASSAAHVEDNARAGEWSLSAEEVSLLERSIPRARPGAPLPLL